MENLIPAAGHHHGNIQPQQKSRCCVCGLQLLTSLIPSYLVLEE